MATTSSQLVGDVLNGFTTSAFEFAVLHDEDDIAAGRVGSDVDVVTRAPIRSALNDRPAGSRILPVILWPYDVAQTATVFFVTTSAREAVQIDALCDPAALGKLGIHSNVLLDHSSPGSAWPRVDPPYSHLYLLRKRHWKAQRDRIPAIVAELNQTPSPELDAAITLMFEPATARIVRALAGGTDPRRLPRETMAYRMRNFARRFKRLSGPPGAWVALTGPGATDALRLAIERFARFLPVCASSMNPGGPVWWATHVTPVRWRPGLFVSAGSHRKWPRPDITIEVGPNEVEDALPRLVTALAARASR